MNCFLVVVLHELLFDLVNVKQSQIKFKTDFPKIVMSGSSQLLGIELLPLSIHNCYNFAAYQSKDIVMFPIIVESAIFIVVIGGE